MKLKELNVRRVVLLAILLIVVVWAVFNHAQIPVIVGNIFLIFRPFIYGLLAAFIINIPMRLIERHLFRSRWKRGEKFRSGLRRIVALVLSLGFLFGVIIAMGFIIVPELVQVARLLSEQIPVAVNDLDQWLSAWAEKNETVAKLYENVQESATGLVEEALTWLQNSLSGIAAGAFTFVTSVANTVMTVIVAFIFAIYCLTNKETLGRQIKRLIYAALPEPSADGLVSLGSLASNVFSKFVAGQAKEAVIQGVMFFVAMTLLGLPYAPMISAFTLVASFIPFYGAFISAFVGAFMILVVDPWQALLFVLMGMVIQQIEGDLIYPHVVGGAVGLPSIWTFVSVTVGGNIAGMPGMILAVPVASIIYFLLAAYVRKRVAFKRVNPLKLGFLLFDPNPAIEEGETKKRQRLAEIVVGAESYQERARRHRIGASIYAGYLDASWREELEAKRRAYLAARMKYIGKVDRAEQAKVGGGSSSGRGMGS